MLAAGGDVSKRVIQREGHWKSDVYKGYIRTNVEDAGKIARKLAVAGKGQTNLLYGGTRSSLRRPRAWRSFHGIVPWVALSRLRLHGVRLAPG